MSLADVLHQAWAQATIQRAVLGDRMAHAYVFHGPDGVGKERFALALAELLLCGEPITREMEGAAGLKIGCGGCEDCRSVAAGTHPDLHLIYRQLNRDHPDPLIRKRKALDIGVDVLRHFVVEKVARTAVRGRAKVFIVREADRITEGAQNALLKTLEEPPPKTVLILLVAALDRLLPTTLSRCQIVRFDALPAAFVQSKLVDLVPDLSDDHAAWYARCSDGSVGHALQCAEDNWYALNHRLLGSLAELTSHDTDSAGKTVKRPDRIAKEWTEASKALGERFRKRDPDITDTEATRRGLKAVFRLASLFYDDVLRYGAGEHEAVTNTESLDSIRKACASIDPMLAGEAIKRLARAERHLDLNVNTQLCVETLVNDLSRLSEGTVPKLV